MVHLIYQKRVTLLHNTLLILCDEGDGLVVVSTGYFLFETLNFKKSADDNKSMKNYMQRVKGIICLERNKLVLNSDCTYLLACWFLSLTSDTTLPVSVPTT